MTAKESQTSRTSKSAGRLPPWIRSRIPAGGKSVEVGRLLADLGLATVCTRAHCPNLAECYARGTATFLIMGDHCTRSCRFCAITSAEPDPLRTDEPEAVGTACQRMKLRHVVITSVTRDDLADGGAKHFADTIRAVRARSGRAVIEVLTSDFQGRSGQVETVLDARPDIFNHNVETVPRLYPQVRPQADYRRSLDVLAHAKQYSTRRGSKLYTKSGLMVGLGESSEEVHQVMTDLRRVGCDILTIGQYLAPSDDHIPVSRYVEPVEFSAWQSAAETLGFAAVAAGPLVRSSYHAESLFQNRNG